MASRIASSFVVPATPRPNSEPKIRAEEELFKLRKEASLFQQPASADTPFGLVVEQFLDRYQGRPAYQDFSNELHWFMGLDLAANADKPAQRAGSNLESGGRLGVPCKSWAICRITAGVVEDYLQRRKEAGLAGYHAFVTLRTLMNWAVKKKFVAAHDLDSIDEDLRRKGRRRYLPSDADVVRIFDGALGKFKELLLVYITTGIRPSELRTVTIDEFDRENRQWVLWRHEIAHRTGKPKIVPLANEAVYQLCLRSADRPSDKALFLNSQGEPWTYNALRLRWYRLRNRLQLDPRFTLYCLRHWFVTVALESGEGEAVVGELAGHVDRDTIDFYKKLRNGPLHQAASRISRTIGRVGIDIPLPEEPK